jgi:segregation and condensation protein B
MASLSNLLEALLLAADRPLAVGDLVELINLAVDEDDWPARVTPDQIEVAVRSMAGDFTRHGGVELVEVGGGWRLRTPPALAPMVRRLWPDRAARLSGAALEVLSIVAYRQPCTRLEVEEVRGVDCGGVLRALLERRLVKIVGKKDEPGRPLLYGTTTEFLETFSLPNLRSMPTLRDLEALRAEEASRTAGERQMDLSLAGDEPQSAQPPSSDSSSGEASSNASAAPPEAPETD